jgi:glycerophosphoryl diester phosphodiesterase
MKQKTFLILLALPVIFSCVSQHKTIQSFKMSFDKEGHRGCRGLMPENTIPAMIKALDLGVNTLEMDAVISGDKKVVVSHDPYFNHEITTKPDGSYVTEQEERSLNIYRMSYEEIKRYDVGLKPHPRFPNQQKMKAVKPLLEELIDSAEAYSREHHLPPVLYNIETKSKPATDNEYHPAPEEFVELLMNVILSRKIESRVVIQSFDPRTLQVIHRKYPFMKTSLLIEDYDKRSLQEQLNELGFTPDIYSPEYSHISDQLIKDCHSLHMKVLPWTVNDKATIQKLKSMGVDGVITDYPNLFGEL